MIYSFCKSQRYIRGSRSCFKDVNFLQKHGLFSFAIRYSSAKATDDKHSFTISYLINSCGLSPQSALAASRKVHFETPQKPDSVVSFLKKHGFSQTQITKLIERVPRFLVSNPGTNLLPKFEFFYSRGVSSSKLAKILSLKPGVLRLSLQRCIIPSFNFFKDVTLCDDDKVIVAYHRNPRILQNDFKYIAGLNLAILRECGVPECIAVRMLVHHPSMFGASQERFKRAVEEVKNLGFNPLKYDFVAAIGVLLQTSKSTLERKLNVLKDYGWSDEEIVSAFGRFPNLLGYSEHKIKATMDYYVNTVGWNSSYIYNSPFLLGLSLEKRVIPRFEVFQVLLSKGLIKETSIRSLLIRTEKDFLQMYVIPYKHLGLVKLYGEKLGNSKSRW